MEMDSGNLSAHPPIGPAPWGRARSQQAWVWKDVKASKTEGREQEELPGGEFIGSGNRLFRNDSRNFLGWGWPRVWKDVEMVSIGFCHLVLVRFWERKKLKQNNKKILGEVSQRPELL